MAAAKIVGLVVTPTTDFSATSAARLPVSMRSRERSSSQIDIPASDSAFSRPLMGLLLSSYGRGSAADGCDAVVGRGRDSLRGDPELLVDPGVVGRGAVVVDRDDPAVVSDVLAPALLHAGLD